LSTWRLAKTSMLSSKLALNATPTTAATRQDIADASTDECSDIVDAALEKSSLLLASLTLLFPPDSPAMRAHVWDACPSEAGFSTDRSRATSPALGDDFLSDTMSTISNEFIEGVQSDFIEEVQQLRSRVSGLEAVIKFRDSLEKERSRIGLLSSSTASTDFPEHRSSRSSSPISSKRSSPFDSTKSGIGPERQQSDMTCRQVSQPQAWNFGASLCGSSTSTVDTLSASCSSVVYTPRSTHRFTETTHPQMMTPRLASVVVARPVVRSIITSRVAAGVKSCPLNDWWSA